MWPTIEADSASTTIDNRGVINVVDDRAIYVGHLRVVKILATSPVAAIKSEAGIAEAVINTAIEAYRRPPIAGVPEIQAIRESPITRGPQESH
jgi:hypothetical protein